MEMPMPTESSIPPLQVQQVNKPAVMTSQEAINILNGRLTEALRIIEEQKLLVKQVVDYINTEIPRIDKVLADHIDSPSHLPSGVMISRYK